jgi:hypothetical protein
MEIEKLMWIAGLLEGEGCFTFKDQKNNKYNISVKCQMTDKDVLERLLLLSGVGHLNGPYGNGIGNKLRYSWSCSGQSAYNLMKELFPYMCSRRQNRIKELMEYFESKDKKEFEILHIASGVIDKTDNLTQWLIDHNMSYDGLYRTLYGERKQCKGWRRIK